MGPGLDPFLKKVDLAGGPPSNPPNSQQHIRLGVITYQCYRAFSAFQLITTLMNLVPWKDLEKLRVSTPNATAGANQWTGGWWSEGRALGFTNFRPL